MVAIGDNELVERYQGVRLDHTNKHFYRGLLDRELRLSRCADCGWWHHRPKPICPRCWSSNVEATPVSGRGTIHLVIFLYQGPPADGVDYTAGPHPVVTVELEEQEGLRFTSTVVGSPNDDIVIGAPVELVWIERDGRPFPVFRLATAPT
ncbi:MAG: zinc ribbon domain-containing protein [Acidimicrobiia bacterium]